MHYLLVYLSSSCVVYFTHTTFVNLSTYFCHISYNRKVKNGLRGILHALPALSDLTPNILTTQDPQNENYENSFQNSADDSMRSIEKHYKC